MEYQVPESKRNARPLPRRGQVKAGIFRGLVRAIIPKTSKNGEKPKKDGNVPSSNSTPAPSGYTSSYDDD